MGTKKNPGKYDCYAKLKDDEPFFVLRGQDKSAPQLVRSWASRAATQGVSQDKVNAALNCATAMEQYAADRGKTAD